MEGQGVREFGGRRGREEEGGKGREKRTLRAFCPIVPSLFLVSVAS